MCNWIKLHSKKKKTMNTINRNLFEQYCWSCFFFCCVFALQFRTLFCVFNFLGFERHWWVFCRRNVRLAYILNLVLVSMMSLLTTTWSMPLLVEIYLPEGITSPVVSTLCADMNCHWYGYIYKFTVYKFLNFLKY